MWPFSSRGSQSGTIAPAPKDLPDFRNFEKDDVSLKIWLPQILVDRVNWMSKAKDVSRPDVIRALLFEHLYGHVAYEALRKYAIQKKIDDGLAYARQNLTSPGNASHFNAALYGNNIIESPARGTAIDLEYLGKSVDDIEVKMPRQLKIDLGTLANTYNSIFQFRYEPEAKPV
jgi:hypothetical protein